MQIAMTFETTLIQTLPKSVKALLAQQKDNGAIDGYCRNRILESALTLHLLQKQAYLPEHQASLKAYLMKAIASAPIQPPTAARIVTLIAKRVMGHDGSTHHGSISTELLEFLANREQGRKALYFGCLLAETGVINFATLPFDIEAFQTQRHPVQTWANVMLSSLKILFCVGTTTETPIIAEEQDFLENKLLRPEIFENNVLTQIVGLLALSKFLPAAALEQPIKVLLSCQQADGGMPLMTNLDNFATPLAGLAILEAIPYLSHSDQQTSRIAVFRMADYLASVQSENGGWSYAQGTEQTDTDDSGLGIALLAQVDSQKFQDNIRRFQQFAARMQNDDGGFPTYIEGNPSTPSMTAAMLHGIAEIVRQNPRESSQWRGPIQQAVEYIVNHQKEDGTFERRWSNAETHAMYRVAIAFRSVDGLDLPPELQKSIENCLQKMTHYLHSRANPDGGWGHTNQDPSDILSTAYAVLCLSQTNQPILSQGVSFLEGQQTDDGTFKSRPDLMGPRPFLYDIPILATITATQAISHFISISRLT